MSKLMEALHIEGLKPLLFSLTKTVEQLILPYLLEELMHKQHELRALSLLTRDIQVQCLQCLHRHVADLVASICDVIVVDIVPASAPLSAPLQHHY